MTFVLRRESRFFGLMIASSMLLGLAGCSDVRRAIGSEKSTPDEFQVVVRPPLSLPPGFADRPEDIAEQEESNLAGLSAAEAAASTFGAPDGQITGYEAVFDFAAIVPDIRTKIDEETYGIQLEKRLPIQTLFGGVPDVGPVLDKMAEDARLREAMRNNQLPTDSETMGIDPLSDTPVLIK
jgi:hypothetical protein